MKNTVLQGDCLELMKDIPTGSVDMILCDLPYGTTACKWDTVISFDLLWEQYKRIIKDNGAIVLTASQPFTSALVMSNPKMFRFSWVWNKKFAGNFSLAKYQPQKIHEDILVFSKNTCLFNPQITIRDKPIVKGKNVKESGSSNISNPKKEYDKKEYSTKQPDSILEFNVRAERGLHPTQKPVALFEYLIKTYSKEGDTILDNCAGSGTTGVACVNTNRNYILMEKEKKYYDIILNRLSLNNTINEWSEDLTW